MSSHRRLFFVVFNVCAVSIAACHLEKTTGVSERPRVAGAAAASLGHQKQCDTVAISAPGQVFAVGQSVPLDWVVYDKNATPVSKATVSWASSAPSVAAISATGVLTALAPGVAEITATCTPFAGLGYFVAIVQ